jgi:hypothetical protein
MQQAEQPMVIQVHIGMFMTQIFGMRFGKFRYMAPHWVMEIFFIVLSTAMDALHLKLQERALDI